MTCFSTVTWRCFVWDVSREFIPVFIGSLTSSSRGIFHLSMNSASSMPPRCVLQPLLSYLLISFNSFFLPSFRVHKPAYSEPVRKPEIERCGWKGFRCKNALGYTVRLTLALVCVAAAGLLVVIQWEAWVRGDQRLAKDLITSRIRRV